MLRHTGLALLLAAVIVALSAAAMYAAPAPTAVSILVEPLSLLLLPGLLVALVAAGPHDFTAQAVLASAFLIYAVAFFLLLHFRAGARTQRGSR